MGLIPSPVLVPDSGTGNPDRNRKQKAMTRNGDGTGYRTREHAV